MNIFDAVILGIVQGLTEFIPVSSSGHLILTRNILGITSTQDLSIDAVLQLATILAVLMYFRHDLWNLFTTFLKVIVRKPVEYREKTLLYAIIVGTIPALVLGILLEHSMETVFRNTDLVAYALIAGSILMYTAEKYATQSVSLTQRKSFIIGCFQALALIPGISRSGATISGGLFQGLSRSDATRFSFLLSFPIIAGSGLKKVLDLSFVGGLFTPSLFVSFLCAFGVGLVCIHYLLKYLNTHTLSVFIWYRVVLAILIVLIL